MSDRLRQKVSIGALSALVLLEIFSFHVDPHPHRYSFDAADDTSLDAWRALVHVCQQWRQVVFASPRSLTLQLLLYERNASKEVVGYLAGFSYRGVVPKRATSGCAQHRCRAPVHRPRV